MSFVQQALHHALDARHGKRGRVTDTQQQILEMLVGTASPLTSAELARRLGVSTRTIKRAMKDVALNLEAHGARLESGNAGYHIVIVDRGAYTSFASKLSGGRSRLTDDDALVRQILCLLVTSDYATQDDLSDELYVSRSKVSRLVKQARDVLDQYQIVLSSRPHYGYYLIGQEEHIRNFLVDWLMRGSDTATYEEPLILARCRNYQEFVRMIRRTLAAAGYEVGDPRVDGLIKYFVAVGCRNAAHQGMTSITEEALVDATSRNLARQVADVISDCFGTHLGAGECEYLANLLGNVSALANDSHDLTTDPGFFEAVVDDCIDLIRTSYGRDFSQDEDLRRGLIAHLYATCSRMQINAMLSLPMLSMVKTQYAEAYDFAVQCGRLLLDRYGLQTNEDSLGYIAMHFAAAIERQNARSYHRVIVVCESGYGTSELLRVRVASRLSQVVVADVLSAKMLAGYDFTDISLVISTVPLESLPPVPCVQVSSLFSDSDVRLVSEYLKYFKDAERIRQFFSRELFFPHLDVRTKDEALETICARLIEVGAITEADMKSVYYREEIASTEINPLVAMPHCILGRGERSCYAVFTTKQPIDWGHTDAQLIIALLISPTTGIDRQMFPMIYRLTKDTDKVRRLVGIDEFGPFMDELFSNPQLEGV